MILLNPALQTVCHNRLFQLNFSYTLLICEGTMPTNLESFVPEGISWTDPKAKLDVLFAEEPTRKVLAELYSGTKNLMKFVYPNKISIPFVRDVDSITKIKESGVPTFFLLIAHSLNHPLVDAPYGNFMYMGTVGAKDSGADMEFLNLSFTAGMTIRMPSLCFTL